MKNYKVGVNILIILMALSFFMSCRSDSCENDRCVEKVSTNYGFLLDNLLNISIEECKDSINKKDPVDICNKTYKIVSCDLEKGKFDYIFDSLDTSCNDDSDCIISECGDLSECLTICPRAINKYSISCKEAINKYNANAIGQANYKFDYYCYVPKDLDCDFEMNNSNVDENGLNSHCFDGAIKCEKKRMDCKTNQNIRCNKERKSCELINN